MKDKQKQKRKDELDINGNPIDSSKEYIGNKVKVPMASPSSSIYKSSAKIILRGKAKVTQDTKAKLLDFLSRAPISFDGE